MTIQQTSVPPVSSWMSHQFTPRVSKTEPGACLFRAPGLSVCIRGFIFHSRSPPHSRPSLCLVVLHINISPTCVCLRTHQHRPCANCYRQSPELPQMPYTGCPRTAQPHHFILHTMLRIIFIKYKRDLEILLMLGDQFLNLVYKAPWSHLLSWS